MSASEPALGVAASLAAADPHRVAALVDTLRRLGIRRLRLPAGDADWAAVLPALAAAAVEVLPVLPADPAAVDAFLAAHGTHVEWVEIDAAGADADTFRAAVARAGAHGRKVVLPADVAGGEGADAVGLLAGGGIPRPDSVAAARSAASGRPLWILDAGYATRRHDEIAGARALLALLESGAERVYWSALEDPADPHAAPGAGLLRADGSPKLAARTFAAGGRAALAAAIALAAPRVKTAAPRIVVTGGAGFLGANLVDALAADGASVLVLDSLGRPGVEENLEWLGRHGHRVAAEIADIRDPYVLEDAVRGAEAVVHLAAQVAVTTSVCDPVADFEVNARGTLNLLEAVRRAAPAAPVLFASTNKVYGELVARDAMVREGERYAPRDTAMRRGFGENTPLSFHSPYGCSKGVADQYVLDYARVYGLNTAVFRMSCLYGPHQFGTEDQGWVAHFLIATLSGQPITIYGDGYQVRDVLYVDDAVAAYRLALKDIRRVAGRAFNLGGGPDNALSLRDFLGMIPDVCGVAPAVSYAGWRPGDQAWYVSDTAALSAATGWRAGVSAPDGIARLATWLRPRFGAVERREARA